MVYVEERRNHHHHHQSIINQVYYFSSTLQARFHKKKIENIQVEGQLWPWILLCTSLHEKIVINMEKKRAGMYMTVYKVVQHFNYHNK